MHTCGSLRGSVTGVVERWILTVPLSPLLAAAALAPLAAGTAPARGPANANSKLMVTSVTPSRMVSLVRQVMVVMKAAFGAGESRGHERNGRDPAAVTPARLGPRRMAATSHPRTARRLLRPAEDH